MTTSSTAVESTISTWRTPLRVSVRWLDDQRDLVGQLGPAGAPGALHDVVEVHCRIEELVDRPRSARDGDRGLCAMRSTNRR